MNWCFQVIVHYISLLLHVMCYLINVLLHTLAVCKTSIDTFLLAQFLKYPSICDEGQNLNYFSVELGLR